MDQAGTIARERPAKNRLTDMLTIAVGIVDRAANERTFLVVKRDDMDKSKTNKADGDAPPPTTPPAEEGAAATAPPAEPAAKSIKLPAAAKQALVDGFMAIFQQLAPVAELINGAEVDDAAPIPAEIVQAIEDAADALDELAERTMPAAPVEQSAGADAATATPPPADDEPTEPAAKAVMKAGRRIAKGRLEQLQGAHELHGKAHELMGSLLKDLTMGGARVGATPPAAAAKPADDETVAKAVEVAVAKALTPVIGPLAEALRTLQSTDAVERMRKAVGAANAQRDEATPPSPKPKTVTWPLDMAEEINRERKSARR